MEIVNWVERYDRDCNNLAAFLITAAVTSIGDKFDWKNLDSSKIEVEFRVNGQELPFVATVQSISEHLDEMIEKAATELIERKLGHSRDVLDEIMSEVRCVVKDKLGISVEE